MNTEQLLVSLKRMATPLSGNQADKQNWFECADVPAFLQETRRGQVPVYVNGPAFYLYSVLLAEDQLTGDYIQDILGWNLSSIISWGFGYEQIESGSMPKLFPPLDHTDTARLNGAEPLFFLRDFADVRYYAEFNQKLAQVLDIHQRVADGDQFFQRLDDNGDFENVAVSLHQGEWRVGSLNADDLEFYMFVTGSVLIRLFDVTRFDPQNFNGWPNGFALRQFPEHEIYAHYGAVPSPSAAVRSAAYLRGFQIVRRTKADSHYMMRVRGEKQRNYAEFLLWDWKHKELREWSCAPQSLSSYFEESDLPFEISPAFFRPEVLLKYKQDPDKYRIQSEMVTCRGIWSVRYGINDAGQVHVCAKDLSYLPYSEQIYWKSFNEAPKAGLAERTIAADFEARWIETQDPLLRLRNVLAGFPDVMVGGTSKALWVGDPDSLRRLSPVVTNSRKEWEDEVLTLCKLVVEGFQFQTLKEIARHLKCDDPQLRSIKLLRASLEARNVAPEIIEEVIAPLDALWGIRSSTSAHRGSRRDTGYRDYRSEFTHLAEACHRGMNALRELVQSQILSV